jgi:hypothetical protein
MLNGEMGKREKKGEGAESAGLGLEVGFSGLTGFSGFVVLGAGSW